VDPERRGVVKVLPVKNLGKAGIEEGAAEESTQRH
jgi:hypothetical protein